MKSTFIENMADKRQVNFCCPDISDLEINEVAKVLNSGWITTGPQTKILERKISEYVGTKTSVCLNSATAAEELILRILGIGDGDEVIVPAYTYTSTAAAVIHTGAKVVLIDSRPGSVEMDYDAAEKAVNKRTKAIIPVDLGGVICDYERIFELVRKQQDKFTPGGTTEFGQKIQNAMGRVAVIADCAHALGAEKKMKGRWHMAGNIADFSFFSFHAVKNFTTAEGGAATWREISGIDNEELYRFFQLYSLHGQSKDALAKTELGGWEYDIVAPLYKCNMTDIMAAMGLKQLERYPGMLDRRREIIEKYDVACDRLGVGHLEHYGTEFNSSGHLYLVRVPGVSHKERCGIIAEMAKRGIACNVHYKPLPLLTAYKNLGFDIKDFPNAYGYFENEITLPLHTKLSDDDIAYVIKNFTEIVKC